MIAYVTSIGEKTTDICCQQLLRFGFNIYLLEGKKEWIDKYKEFIDTAAPLGVSCIRVDADVIVNKNIATLLDYVGENYQMVQFSLFDFYSLDIINGQPVWYSAGALKTIQDNFGSIDNRRPEASAWRLPQINSFTRTYDRVMGMHGFFQDDDHLNRAEKHKIERKQIQNYDFELARELLEIK